LELEKSLINTPYMKGPKDIEEQQEALQTTWNKITWFRAKCCAVLAALLYSHVPLAKFFVFPTPSYNITRLFLNPLKATSTEGCIRAVRVGLHHQLVLRVGSTLPLQPPDDLFVTQPFGIELV
jgi:hypothetical protein